MASDANLVTLQTVQDRIDLLIRRERFASYRYDMLLPGFTGLYAPGERAVTRQTANGVALWLGHADVNGVSFTASGASGRIMPVKTTARRGSQTVGFQQECDWIDPAGQTLLTDRRTIRALPGPGDGRILDISLRLTSLEGFAVNFGRSDHGLLALHAASAFFVEGMGQVRNSQGDYGSAQIQGRSAAWCACVGVVQGVTVGFALLDHPSNPFFPSPWSCREDGTLSPLIGSGLKLPPARSLTLRYRLLVYAGYVETGWADARLREFSAE